MPLYEYRCGQCRRRVTLLVRSPVFAPVCPACGGRELSRLISTFAVVRSPEARYERLAEPEMWQDFDEQDPRKMAKLARNMKDELGDDLGPEFDDAVERMEEGEMPDEMGGEGLGEGLTGEED